jgi:hypothetical protein
LRICNIFLFCWQIFNIFLHFLAGIQHFLRSSCGFMTFSCISWRISPFNLTYFLLLSLELGGSYRWWKVNVKSYNFSRVVGAF